MVLAMAEDEPRRPSTPFENPWFLPVVLGLLTLWFGYDGWFNPEMEWIRFNRIGFGVCLLATLWYTRQALRDRRDAEGDAAGDGREGP